MDYSVKCTVEEEEKKSSHTKNLFSSFMSFLSSSFSTKLCSNNIKNKEQDYLFSKKYD